MKLRRCSIERIIKCLPGLFCFVFTFAKFLAKVIYFSQIYFAT